MNKKALSLLLCAAMLGVSLAGCGLGKKVNEVPKSEYSIVYDIFREFTKPGPTKQLQLWDKNIMQPALSIAKELASKPELKQDKAWLQSRLQNVQAWRKELEQEKAVRMTDEYLYFGKKYLAALENILAGKSSLQGDEFADSQIGFDNARSKTFEKKELYKFASFDAKSMRAGMTYKEIRKMLNMPGVHLKAFEVPALKGNPKPGKYEPVLWVYNDKFLYVEFMEGKAISWKYYEPPVFGTTNDKEILAQIKTVEKEVMQPAIALYKEYTDKKNVLAKEKIYNEKAAKMQADWLKTNLPKFKDYRQKVESMPKDKEETKQYYKYALLYLQQVEERLTCAQNLVSEKDARKIRVNVVRGNNLESRLIWETRYVYQNAKSFLLEKERSYKLHRWVLNIISHVGS